MHHFGKAKDQEGEGFALGGQSRNQTQGDEIRLTGKMSFRLAIIMSQYEILDKDKIEEQDFRSVREMDGRSVRS
jgi:hypothetical protein